MRISIVLFLVSAASLLELNHHTNALGIDSTSHGLLYGGRVVRRYGKFGGENLFNKRYSVGSRRLQERADPPTGDEKDEKKPPAPKNPKVKEGAKAKEDTKDGQNGKQQDKLPAAPKTPEISENEPPKDAKEPPKEPVKSPKKDPASKDPSDTDTTTANQDQAPPAMDAGTPQVPTGTMSTSAVGGLVSVGGVFVLVAGLFAFSKRRKNKEMTKNIMTTSAKAWEHQNSTYEKMSEETNPIGSYTVIATYTPTLNDELDIQPGDKVTILVEFDDGWVQGINETRGGTKGVFPRHCVDMDHIASSNINKRSSSIGGYGEKYTEVDLN